MLRFNLLKRLPRKPFIALALLAVALAAAGSTARNAQAATEIYVTAHPYGTSITFSISNNVPLALEELKVCEVAASGSGCNGVYYPTYSDRFVWRIFRTINTPNLK